MASVSDLIASQKQFRRRAAQIADGNGKHAMQAVQAIFEAVGAIFFVEMNDGFGIGMRTKAVPLAFELMPQIGEVVDLAVVGDPHCPIFVAHGHVAVSGEVKNGQPAASQSDVSTIGETPLPEPGVVGTAMRLHVRHADEGLPVAAVHESADAAHNLSSSASAARKFSLSSGTFAPLERCNRSAPVHRREIPDEKHSDTGREESGSLASDRDSA